MGSRWTAWLERRAVARRPIDDGLWRRTLARYPFLRRRNPADELALRRLTSLFLDRKEFHAQGKLRVSNHMAVTVAVQACLPVLRLGLAPYAGFVGIVLHACAVVARREVHDDAGLVHEYDEVLSGEAMAGGPLMLSWRDVRDAGQTAAVGYNVVIHEFAHVIDMACGLSGEHPQLPATIESATWRQALAAGLESLRAAQARGEETVLDPYGAESPEEFFAVASEAFFVSALRMRDVHPVLYTLFTRLYRQDPATEAV